VLGAKLSAGLILAAAAAAVALAVGLAAIAIAEATGQSIQGDHGWAVLAVGVMLFGLLNAAAGMAFGALLHNTAAAIVLAYLLPTVWGIVFTIGPLKKAGDWVDTSKTFDWVLRADWSGHTGQILTSALLWIALPLAAGLARTVRREVA
jgi:hypothetical protein